MELLRVVPSLDQTVTNGVRHSLVGTLVVEVESGSRQSVLDVINDRALD